MGVGVWVWVAWKWKVDDDEHGGGLKRRGGIRVTGGGKGNMCTIALM